MRLEKITFDYSQQEDRLCIMAQAPDGEAIVLWLTQRLCKNLAMTLLAHLENSTPLPQSANKELMMAFRQSAALLEKEAALPVQSQNNTRSSRVDVVDIRLSSEGVELAFHVPDAEPARLRMNTPQLRQILQIMLSIFQRAQWPTESWPNWILEADVVINSAAANAAALH